MNVLVFELAQGISSYNPLSYLDTCHLTYWASQVALVVKNSTANAGDIRDVGSIPGSGRSPRGGHGNPPQYSCLESLMDREVWRATVRKVVKSQTPWGNIVCMPILLSSNTSVEDSFLYTGPESLPITKVCRFYQVSCTPLPLYPAVSTLAAGLSLSCLHLPLTQPSNWSVSLHSVFFNPSYTPSPN